MRIASIIVITFAGTALANPFLNASHSSETATHNAIVNSGRGAMHTIDLAGIQSWDAAGSPLNHRLSLYIGANTTVTAIGWDNVVIQTAGDSWLSEARINFLNSPIGLNLAPGTANGFSGTGGPYTSNGLLDLASIDPTFPFQVGADGMLNLEFFESFDDITGAPDAVWLSGTLMINYPAPGSLAVMMAGLTFAARRRR